MAIVVKLDELLHQRRMSLTELAERIEITLANLSILKTGKARAIRFSTLEAICDVLGCQPGDLLQFEADTGAAEQRAPPEQEKAYGVDRRNGSGSPNYEKLSLLRLNVMRLLYFLIAFGEGSQVVPDLFVHGPAARGVIPALLSGFCLMCVLGLKYPRQMLPLLMFEFAWKYIWFFAFGLAQYLTGQAPATFAADFRRLPAVWRSCRS